MTTARRIAVVSAGLSNPSSTRMLADRLAASTVAALGQTTGADGQPIPVEVGPGDGVTGARSVGDLADRQEVVTVHGRSVSRLDLTCT